MPGAQAESPDFADRCSYIDDGDPENIALNSTTNKYITDGDDCEWEDGEEDYIARWSPNLLAGNYDVYVRWAPNAAYDKNVLYIVVPDDLTAESEIKIDQSIGGGTFGDKTAPTQHYLSNFTFTAAGYDVAMAYYENDLDPNMNDFVPTNSRDLAEHQHMVTYTIGFGVEGTLTLDPDYLDTGVYPTWTDPHPTGADSEKIDDLMHAAVNGRGRYLSAQNSLELINDLYLVLKDLDNGGTFRNRTWQIADQDHPYNGSVIASSRLGDIVHASPVYRDGVLYSGGNDGMLHAFDASTGEEFFAYVPNLVFANLPNLIDPTFGHQFYVDLTPKIAEVDLSGITTMLVGGLGKGGRGYYALDLTDVSTSGVVYPVSESNLASMVMWEFPNWSTSNTVVADLGYSYSRPEIVKTYDPDHPYILIFGNGYDSVNGRSILFILDPATGQLIKRIDTGVGTCNGLSTPIAVDVDYDDTVDYVYAGDLKGNLWKFDLTSDDSANWDVAYYEGGTKMPLFKAAGQPITTRPDVMYHCEKDGYLVLFGTGKYLEDWDLSDTSGQAVYGIWDYGDDADDGEHVGTISNGTFTPSTLLSSDPVSILAQSVVNIQTAHGLELRTLSNGQADWTTTTWDPSDGTTCGDTGTENCDPNGTGTHPDPVRDVGWYFDLPDAGERVVSDVIAREGNLIVLTYTPGGSMCATGGHSWVMAMDACSGGRLAEANFDVNGDGMINDQDLVDIGTDTEIWAPPTGIQYTGRLQPPAILILSNEKETLYMSSSIGDIETLGEKAAKLGVY